MTIYLASNVDSVGGLEGTQDFQKTHPSVSYNHLPNDINSDPHQASSILTSVYCMSWQQWVGSTIRKTCAILPALNPHQWLLGEYPNSFWDDPSGAFWKALQVCQKSRRASQKCLVWEISLVFSFINTVRCYNRYSEVCRGHRWSPHTSDHLPNVTGKHFWSLPGDRTRSSSCELRPALSQIDMR